MTLGARVALLPENRRPIRGGNPLPDLDITLPSTFALVGVNR
jgi:hypothetical protein